jgi:hypothetical protein
VKLRALAVGTACLFVAVGPLRASPAHGGGAMATLDSARSLYLERCGGCHGIQGRSAPADVPVISGNVGKFLCTQEGRDYLVRLPSVATTPVDDQRLAQLMNFVVFELGGTRPDLYRKYTATEIHELRTRPLNEVSLKRYRARLVAGLGSHCRRFL